MTKVKRTIIGIVAVEAMLGGLWAYLALNGVANPERISPAFYHTLGSTMGSAMGAFLGFSTLLLAMARKNDMAARTRAER